MILLFSIVLGMSGYLDWLYDHGGLLAVLIGVMIVAVVCRVLEWVYDDEVGP